MKTLKAKLIMWICVVVSTYGIQSFLTNYLPEHQIFAIVLSLILATTLISK